MTNEVLLALILQEVEEKLNSLPYPSRGATGPRGPVGAKGEDGKSFVFSEHEDQIKSWAKEFALKFEDLSEEQILSLKGERGRDGKDGKDGRDFAFAEHQDSIATIIRDAVDSISPQLKLNFSDLTDEERESLRGPKGKKGDAGKSFVYEEHEEKFKAYAKDHALKFQDLSPEERESLVLKFNQLTEDEINSLKLRFSDLTEDEKNSIRGPRGKRGQIGKTGRDGEKGERGEDGKRGKRGVPGAMGATGLTGLPGRDGRDGADAPYIVNIEVIEIAEEFYFEFTFSDGSRIQTNRLDLPRHTVTSFGSGGFTAPYPVDGGGSGTPGVDGKSAYELAVENGFSGTLAQWLTSLVGPAGQAGEPGEPGADGQAATIQIGTVTTLAPGSPATVQNVGTPQAAILNFRIPRGFQGLPGSGGSGGNELLDMIDCEPDVYVGSAVVLKRGSPTPSNMSEWPSLFSLPTLSAAMYTPFARNGLADSKEDSNIIGIVESKSSPTTCAVRVGGISDAIYFGLDVEDEYYLSDTEPGKIVPSAQMPTAIGSILVKLGQPFSSTQFVYDRGDRTQIEE